MSKGKSVYTYLNDHIPCLHQSPLGASHWFLQRQERVFAVLMRWIVPMWISAYTSGQSLVKGIRGVPRVRERQVTEVVVKNGKRNLERDLPTSTHNVFCCCIATDTTNTNVIYMRLQEGGDGCHLGETECKLHSERLLEPKYFAFTRHLHGYRHYSRFSAD